MKKKTKLLFCDINKEMFSGLIQSYKNQKIVFYFLYNVQFTPYLNVELEPQ